ncbi:hypothetical protein [Caldalkalibacillus salinus]|uniref:hypothetical protein n=1 Tax=Caldalkalibacillus salinus TaxID=2803787 RepID=UPI001922BF52|nr:hypothetical protein [Caldalkalibacillus salinus]
MKKETLWMAISGILVLVVIYQYNEYRHLKMSYESYDISMYLYVQRQLEYHSDLVDNDDARKGLIEVMGRTHSTGGKRSLILSLLAAKLEGLDGKEITQETTERLESIGKLMEPHSWGLGTEVKFEMSDKRYQELLDEIEKL